MTVVMLDFFLNYGKFVNKVLKMRPRGDWPADFILMENSSQFSLKNGSNSGCGLIATTSLSLTQISWKRHLASLFLCSGVASSHALATLPRNSANCPKVLAGTWNGDSFCSSLWNRTNVKRFWADSGATFEKRFSLTQVEDSCTSWLIVRQNREFDKAKIER